MKKNLWKLRDKLLLFEEAVNVYLKKEENQLEKLTGLIRINERVQPMVSYRINKQYINYFYKPATISNIKLFLKLLQQQKYINT